MRMWKMLIVLLPAALASAAPAAEPALRDNAALKYWLGFAQMNYDKATEKFIDEWSTIPLDERTDKLLDSSRVILLQMHRGARIRDCDWSLDYEDGPSMLLPHFNKTRTLTKLAALNARREFGRGNAAGAIDDALAALSLARHTNSDFTLISILVRYANEATIFELLAPHLPKLDRALLAKLAAALDAPPGGGTVPESIMGEKKYMAGWLLRKMKEAEEKKPGSYRDVLKVTLETEEAPNVFQVMDSYEKSVKMTEELMPVYDELARLYALPPGEFDMQYPKYAKKIKAQSILAGLLMPALEKVAAAQRRNQTQRALFRAAIAIIQGGPDKVKETKDPFGDGPFEYRAMEGGFELKSKFKFKDQPVTMTIGQEKK